MPDRAGGGGSTGVGPYEQLPPGVRSSGRVALLGRWSAAHVNALTSTFTVVASWAAARAPVDWLLVAVGPGMPTSVRRLRREVPVASTPGVRLAVVDPGRRWLAGEDCAVYIGGDVEPRELVGALWLAARGFSVTKSAAPAKPPRALPEALTDRETELLRALCAGLGNDQIARELNISRSTVEFHLTRIFKKLQVTSRAEAIVRVLHQDHQSTLSRVS